MPQSLDSQTNGLFQVLLQKLIEVLVVILTSLFLVIYNYTKLSLPKAYIVNLKLSVYQKHLDFSVALSDENLKSRII